MTLHIQLKDVIVHQLLEAMIHFAALQKHNIVNQLYSNKIFLKVTFMDVVELKIKCRSES